MLDLANNDAPTDSAWINVDGTSSSIVTDSSSNVQMNPANLRVPVTFIARRYYIEDTTPATATKSCGCGSGTGLALIPPLFYYSRRKIKKQIKES
jgi:hypothetical protein